MKMKPILLATALATALNGCAWLNPGEEEFACSGMPGSVFCHSARDVYMKTNSGVVPSPIRGNTYNPECTDCVRAEDENPELFKERGDGDYHGEYGEAPGTKRSGRKTLDVRDDDLINNYVTPYLPNRPVPIRTPAQVMRIWVGPYVDTAGDLVAPGIVYTEIEPRKWIYPDRGTASGGMNDRVMRPLADRGLYEGGSDPAATLASGGKGREIDFRQPRAGGGKSASGGPQFSALSKLGKKKVGR